MGIADNIDLSTKHRATVVALLKAHLPGATVWAYGSRVTWAARDNSDLDLVVFAASGRSAQVGALREAFDESELPFRVDLFVWDDVPESFRSRIEAEHVVLIGDQQMRTQARTAPLSALAEIRLSGVDKKTVEGESHIRLCNYTDVYYNDAIRGSMPFMRATATEREIEKCRLLAGDVVITKDSEQHDDIGVPALVKETAADLVCGYHLAILRPNEKTHGPYLFYAISDRSTQQQFHAYANGVTRFGLRKADIGLVQVPIPEYPRQVAIARVLGALDDRIELNRRMNETLDAMARALFKSWFVDFDPVRAKMEGRESGLLPDIADLFPDRLVESDLGEVPDGWDVLALDQIATFRNGLALQKYRPEDDEDWLPVLKIAQLRAGVADGAERARASIPPEVIVEDGDIVFSWSGSLELRVWTGGSVALNQHLFKVTSDVYPKWFFFRCVATHLNSFRAIAAGKATTMGHIKREHLREARCVVPDRDFLEAVGPVFEPLMHSAIWHGILARELAVTRDTLLPRLVSGELRLPAALVSEAA